jgi:hypothetical protein
VNVAKEKKRPKNRTPGYSVAKKSGGGKDLIKGLKS